jgi:N,N'-diacetylbacillosaminyl-diphospho-undecaprenol alpha-1,3-N-acetylgalactosaminyltransferase
VFISHLDINLFLFRLPVMRTLVDQGHQVVAVCPRGAFTDKFVDYGIDVCTYTIDRKSFNPFKEIITFFKIILIFRQIKPDVLHAFTIKPCVYSALASRFANIPSVYGAITGLGSIFVDASRCKINAAVYLSYLMKFAFQFVDKVVFQNDDDLNFFVERRILPRSKAALIRGSGVDTEFFCMKRISSERLDGLRQRLSLPLANVVVLMVGRAIRHKGVVEYIQAAAKVREQIFNVDFVLVGGVDDGNPSSVSRDYLCSQSHIHWLGHRDDIAELTALCDICVLPSYREGVPRSLLEAAAMGKPIVTTDAVGCREVVEDGVNGFLVPVRDVGALAQRIVQLIQDAELRERMGRAGRLKAVQEFDVRHVVRQYLDLYGVH